MERLDKRDKERNLVFSRETMNESAVHAVSAVFHRKMEFNQTKMKDKKSFSK